MRLSAIIAIIVAALLLLLAATYVKSMEEPKGKGGIFVERSIKPYKIQALCSGGFFAVQRNTHA